MKIKFVEYIGSEELKKALELKMITVRKIVENYKKQKGQIKQENKPGIISPL